MKELTDKMIIGKQKKEVLYSILILCIYLIMGIGILIIGIYASVDSKSVIPFLSFLVIDMFVIGLSYLMIKKHNIRERELLNNNYSVIKSVVKKKYYINNTFNDALGEVSGSIYYYLIFEKNEIKVNVSSIVYGKIKEGDECYIVVWDNGRTTQVYLTSKYIYNGAFLDD